MIQSKVLEFARVELYKERCKGKKMKHQYLDMGMSIHSLDNFMRGRYNTHPVTKIFEYLFDNGYIKLCPQKNEKFLPS